MRSGGITTECSVQIAPSEESFGSFGAKMLERIGRAEKVVTELGESSRTESG